MQIERKPDADTGDKLDQLAQQLKPFDKPTEKNDVDVKNAAMTTNVMAFDLPSCEVFYNNTNAISARDIAFRELALLGAASETGSFRSLAEALSNTILNFNGMEMTYGDMQFIMYYHRIKLNRPIELQWTCNHEDHVALVLDEDSEVTKDSFDQYKMVNKSDIETVKINMDKINEVLSSERALKIEGENLKPLFLSPISVQSVVEISEEAEDLAGRDDLSDREIGTQLAQLNFTNKYASLLCDRHGKTIFQKRQALNEWFDQEGLNIQTAMAQLEKFYIAQNHGVKETVHCKCEVCGHETDVNIRFEPTDFFPVV